MNIHILPLVNFIYPYYTYIKERGDTMARRSKEYKTTEHKLMDITNEIITAEEHLQNLKAQKKELEKDLEQEKVAALLASIRDKNISIDRAKEIIDNMHE
jgi:Asp-tRNA(Asn)/Glu-tRNA(Gln) amidotransferase B subunit